MCRRSSAIFSTCAVAVSNSSSRLIADARFEGREDIVLAEPLDRDDEGKAEFLDIGRVELGEAGMFAGAQPVETGAGLLLAGCPRSVRRQSPAGRQDRDGRASTPSRSSGLAARKMATSAVCTRPTVNGIADEAVVIGTFGDERRMLEDAAEARYEIISRYHQTASGL